MQYLECRVATSHVLPMYQYNFTDGWIQNLIEFSLVICTPGIGKLGVEFKSLESRQFHVANYLLDAVGNVWTGIWSREIGLFRNSKQSLIHREDL